ncbi:MAG TPA: GerAB/ArcD/ProY family transporter [Gelria sp.]|jgi:spore germination protein KB|nr:GerAB/ArcD/ProY family transporter [Gelria sp.]
MAESSLSERQLAFMLFMSLMGNALILAPISGSGRDAWISSLLAAVIGLYLLFAIISIQKAFPGQSIIKISEICLGKLAGKTLNLIFITMIFYSIIIYLFDTCILIRTIFPFLTCNILRSLIIISTAYCIYRGVNAVGRLADLLAPLTLLFIVGSLLVISTVADFSRLQPIVTNWRMLVGGTLDGAGWPYSVITILALFLPFRSDTGERNRLLYIWFFAGVIIFTIRNILVLSILGPEYVLLTRFPLYASLRFVAFADFQRVELFFFILWFVSGFMVLLINYTAGVLAVKEFFKLPNFKSIILPIGFFLVVMSLYMYNSDMEFYTLEGITTPIIKLSINLLYPTIILLAIKIRGQSLQSPQIQSRPVSSKG